MQRQSFFCTHWGRASDWPTAEGNSHLPPSMVKLFCHNFQCSPLNPLNFTRGPGVVTDSRGSHRPLASFSSQYWKRTEWGWCGAADKQVGLVASVVTYVYSNLSCVLLGETYYRPNLTQNQRRWVMRATGEPYVLVLPHSHRLHCQHTDKLAS